MPSGQNPISISNLALSWLGANLITSFEDNTPESKFCKANYEPLRDAVLETYEWSFAMNRKRYGAITTPVEDLSEDDAYDGYRFKLTPETLRVVQVSRDIRFAPTDNLDWYLEARHVVANQTPIFVRSIQRIEQVADFSEGFVQTLAARLAYELALPLTESNRKQQQMFAVYASKLDESKTLDGMQGKTQRLRSTWMRRARQR